MPFELIYTSAPRGLRAGSSGYCTVAQTQGLREDLAAALERRSLFAHEPKGESPVYYSFRYLSTAGTTWRVLSRAQDAGLDFTGRRHYLVHHLVIEPTADLTGVQPVEILLGWRGWNDTWSTAPEIRAEVRLEDLRSPAASIRLPAREWKKMTGDAGWAAFPHRLASPSGWFTENLSSRDLLRLMGESTAVLEEKQRGKSWMVPLDAGGPANPIPKDCLWVGRTPWTGGGGLAGVRSVLRLEECRGKVPEGQAEEIRLARSGQGTIPTQAGPSMAQSVPEPISPREVSSSKPPRFPARGRVWFWVFSLALTVLMAGFFVWQKQADTPPAGEDEPLVEMAQIAPVSVPPSSPSEVPSRPLEVASAQPLRQALWSQAGGREPIQKLFLLFGVPVSVGVIGYEISLLLPEGVDAQSLRGPGGLVSLQTEEERKKFIREAARRTEAWTLFVPANGSGLAYLPELSAGSSKRKFFAAGQSPQVILEEIGRGIHAGPERVSLLIRFPPWREKEFLPVRVVLREEEGLWIDRVSQHWSHFRHMRAEALRKLAPELGRDPGLWDEETIQAAATGLRKGGGLSQSWEDFRQLNQEVLRWAPPPRGTRPGLILQRLLETPGVICEVQLDKLVVGRLVP